MTKKNKSNTLSGKRQQASGEGYFARGSSLYRTKAVEVTEKEARRAEKLAKKKEKKNRVGPISKPFLGQRTRVIKVVEQTRLWPMVRWTDPASGPKFYIPGFRSNSGEVVFTDILRHFFNDNMTFFNSEQRNYMVKEFLREHRFSETEQLVTLNQRCLRLKNNLASMRKLVDKFGPAFLPYGFVLVEKKRIYIHRIPIKNGDLDIAQQTFMRSSTFWADKNVQPLSESELASRVQERIQQNLKFERKLLTKETSKKVVEKKTSLFYGTGDAPASEPASSLRQPGPNNARNKQAKQKKKEKKSLPPKSSAVNSAAPTNGLNDGTGTAATVEDPIITIRNARNAKIVKEFRCSPRISGVSKHRSNKLNEPEYIDSLEPVECRGSPFCGYVSIDCAIEARPDVNRYITLLNDADVNDAYEIGDSDHLADYCQERNFNLLILKKRNELTAVELNTLNVVVSESTDLNEDSKYVCLSKNEFAGNNNWVVLLHLGPIANGHYNPMIVNRIIEVVPLPIVTPSVIMPAFYQEHSSYEVLNSWVNTELQDDRPIQVRREKIEIIDTYSSVREKQYITINFWMLCSFLVAFAYSMVLLAIRSEVEDEITHRFNEIVTKIKLTSCVLGMISFLIFSPVINRWLALIGNTVEARIGIFGSFMILTRLFQVNTIKYCAADKVGCIEIYETTEYNFWYIYYSFLEGQSIEPVVRRNYFPFNYYLIMGCLIIGSLFRLFHYMDIYLCRKFKRNRSLAPRMQYEYSTREFVVSNSLASIIDAQMQLTPLELIDWSFLNRTKYVGTAHTMIDGVLANTKRYMIAVYKSRERDDQTVSRVRGNRGMVALNTNSTSSYISSEKLRIIEDNQLRGLSNGTGFNYVKSVRFDREPLRAGIPIATAPIGSPKTDQGPTGPGLLPLTDTLSVLAAFCGRSMIREPVEDMSFVQEFVDFSKGFLQSFIDATDCTGIIEKEPIEFFRTHYQGKRSLQWIEGMISQYSFYEKGFADISFDRHSCFVKLENSAKKVGEFFEMRPRLIMTMSPVMLFKCCRMLEVIERWNQGPISKFQIKDLTPADMVSKIVEASDRPHCVTDYSSFESSIMGKIREIENFVLMSLLAKAGMTDTLRAFEEYIVGPRVLKSHGVSMVIDSRCSGDPHTSCGNGIVNFCIAAFCAFKKGLDINQIMALFEGDDGLIDRDIPDVTLINKIGFDFSSSLMGLYVGDTDFLRRRWMNGKAFLNIGRSLSVFWVKNKANLRLEKQKFILRCMGCSLHYMSPGHPVLFAIVNRIGRETTGVKKFDNWFLHIDMYKWPDFDVDNYPQNVLCDESMRDEVAMGAEGFPPIPTSTQIELERIFMFDEHMNIGDRLNHYEDVLCYVSSLIGNSDQRSIYSESMIELLRILNVNG